MDKILFPIHGSDLYIALAVYWLPLLLFVGCILVIKRIGKLSLWLYTESAVFTVAYALHGILSFCFYTHICLPIWLMLCFVLWHLPTKTALVSRFYRRADKAKHMTKADSKFYTYVSQPIKKESLRARLKTAADMTAKVKVGKYAFPPIYVLSIGVVMPTLLCFVLWTSQYEDCNSLALVSFDNAVVTLGIAYPLYILTKYACIENPCSKYYGSRFIKYVYWILVLFMYGLFTWNSVNTWQK